MLIVICYNKAVREIKTTRLPLVLLSMLALSTGPAIAGENNNNGEGLPRFVTSSYQNEFGWRYHNADFRGAAPASEPGTTGQAFEQGLAAANPQALIETAMPLKEKTVSNEQDYIDNMLDKVPYSKQLKATWNFIDGDTDVYFEGLRVDRGNKGLQYRTNTVPFMGEVEGVEIKAEAGEEQAIGFKSSHIPFFGPVEGLELKAAAGTDSSKASVRYTVSLDRLGL